MWIQSTNCWISSIFVFFFVWTFSFVHRFFVRLDPHEMHFAILFSSLCLRIYFHRNEVSDIVNWIEFLIFIIAAHSQLRTTVFGVRTMLSNETCSMGHGSCSFVRTIEFLKSEICSALMIVISTNDCDYYFDEWIELISFAPKHFPFGIVCCLWTKPCSIAYVAFLCDWKLR